MKSLEAPVAKAAVIIGCDMSNEMKVDAITCLDDVPKLARKSLWQQRISRYYMPIALSPFVFTLFVVLMLFSSSTNKVWDVAILLTLGWAIAVAAYAFYSLFWGVSCPACGSYFGVRDFCRSCDLPRHQRGNSVFDFGDKVRLFDKD